MSRKGRSVMMHIQTGDRPVCGCGWKTVVALTLILVSAPSFATTYTWTGGANDGGKWSTPANWGKESGYPGSASGDTANIGIDAEVDLDVTPKNKLNYLKFPFGSRASVRVNGNGKTITVGTQVNVGSDSATSTSSVVLDNLTINYTGSSAVTIYKNTKLALENDSKILATKVGLNVNPPCSVTLDDSTQEVSSIQVVNGTNYKSADFFIRGTHPLLKVLSNDNTGAVYTKTGKDLSFYFDIPKGGYKKDVNGNVHAPIQVDSTTKKFLEGSGSSSKINFYIMSDSEALTRSGKKTYTLVSANAGTATGKATLNNIVPTEDSKTSATLAWEDETVEDVTTVGKYLKATIDNPPKGFMILIKGSIGENPKSSPSEKPTADDPKPETQVPALPRVAGLSDAEQGLYEKVVAAFDAVNPIDEATGGRKYISFGFITDEHSCKRVEGDDAATDPVKDYWYYGGASLTKCDHSIRLLGAVSGKVGLDAVFNGGDFATGNSIVGLTDEEYLGQVAYVKGLFAQYLPTTPFFTVDGNHDRNYPAGTVNGQSVPGHVWNDAQWRTALELFNSDVSQNAAVQVTMHRDLAHPTVGSENPGTYVGNSYHVDCTRLMAAGKPNVRFVCVSEYDSTPGNGKLLRMYDGFQFYDPVTQELIDPAKTPENTLVCIISHGNMGTALDQAASGYLNAGSRKGASTQQAQLNSNLGAHKGLGFIGSVAGHAHQTLVKPIDEDGVRKSSCVQVKECYAGHSSTSASGYRFSLFTVDTDLKKLHETRVVDGKAVNYSTEIDMK